MTPIRRQLLDMIENPDHAFSRTESELAPLRLQAAQELFEERKTQIPLVARRAEDAGITRINSFDDLVPLLFAHTVYKSYPASFIEQGRWDRMLTWLNTLSVRDVTNVNVDGVKNVDDWLERLGADGHRMLCTSGTTGKSSFLNHTAEDYEMKRRHHEFALGWHFNFRNFMKAKHNKLYFWLGPIKGYISAIQAAQINIQNMAQPAEFNWLSDEPQRMSEISHMAAMRKKMAEGSATPDEIREYEAQMAEKSKKGQADLVRMVDLIIERRHEPMYLAGLWAQHMAIIKRARESGISDGDFHPDSIIAAGGGVKAVPLPPDYKEQVSRFYGLDRRPQIAVYGMTELFLTMPACEAGRYHIPPGLIPLILNEPGDRQVERPSSGGVVEGRFGFVDLLIEGRWGGLITGDKVQMDFASKCACGRPGPVILDTITRWAAPGQDDAIGCAGTIDAYIKGAVS